MWETDTFFSPFQSISSTEVWNSRHGQETRQCHNTCHWGWCQWRRNDPDSSRWSGDQWQWGHASNQLLGLCHCTGQMQEWTTAISSCEKCTVQPCSAPLASSSLQARSMSVSFSSSCLEHILGILWVFVMIYASEQSSTSLQSFSFLLMTVQSSFFGNQGEAISLMLVLICFK